MCASGTTFEMSGVKVRPVPGTGIRIRWPSRILPSMLVTVEFQRRKPLASVSNVQILAGEDWMLTSTRHINENVRRAWVTRGPLTASGTGVNSLQEA